MDELIDMYVRVQQGVVELQKGLDAMLDMGKLEETLDKLGIIVSDSLHRDYLIRSAGFPEKKSVIHGSQLNQAYDHMMVTHEHPDVYWETVCGSPLQYKM